MKKLTKYKPSLLILGFLCLLHPTVSHIQDTMNSIAKVCGGDTEKALEHVIASARNGNSTATFLMAKMFAENDEPDLALKYLEVSADQGSNNAMKALGQFALGDKDFTNAKYWFEKAAKLRNVNAVMNLGIMYRDGLGVKQSHETAYFWFITAQKLKKTSAEGDIEPSEFASGVSVTLSASKIAEIAENSDSWIEKNPEPPKESMPKCPT